MNNIGNKRTFSNLVLGLCFADKRLRKLPEVTEHVIKLFWTEGLRSSVSI